MSTLDHYLAAATRTNTRDSYRSALRHYEVTWGGFLPATADSVARYLVEHAGKLSLNTLRQRLAALAAWHVEQGFPDPTKAPMVRKAFRGIQALHPAKEKRARPLGLDQLEQVVRALDGVVATGHGAVESAGDDLRPSPATARRAASAPGLRPLRDKALLLLGFWRGFRGDELTRLRVEHVEVVPGEGMLCYFPRTKSDRAYQGTTFKVPALRRLCPVAAYQDWIAAAQLEEGPVFRAIDRWGRVSAEGLHPDSLIPWLRSTLAAAGLAEVGSYSSHSLRRGFANWATANGWDVKTLMEYVGWKNVQTVVRYVEAADPFAGRRIDAALAQRPALPSAGDGARPAIDQ